MYEPLSSKIPRLIAQNTDLLDSSVHKLTIKISGDGTWVGKRLHLVNFVFSIIMPSLSTGNHLLAIAKVHEKYGELADVLQPLSDEVCNLKKIYWHGKLFKLEYLPCGDLTVLNSNGT